MDANIRLITRREIEARMIVPLLEAFSNEFGRDVTIEIARQTIIQMAEKQGRQLAAQTEMHGLSEFAGVLESWMQDGALELEVIESNTERLAFNVNRCRYAEMYTSLGCQEFGELLSCSRDYAFAAGFNPAIELVRTQTIMNGDSCCTFRFQINSP
jgi:hypothetical protein